MCHILLLSFQGERGKPGLPGEKGEAGEPVSTAMIDSSLNLECSIPNLALSQYDALCTNSACRKPAIRHVWAYLRADNARTTACTGLPALFQFHAGWHTYVCTQLCKGWREGCVEAGRGCFGVEEGQNGRGSGLGGCQVGSLPHCILSSPPRPGSRTLSCPQLFCPEHCLKKNKRRASNSYVSSSAIPSIHLAQRHFPCPTFSFWLPKPTLKHCFCVWGTFVTAWDAMWRAQSHCY